MVFTKFSAKKAANSDRLDTLSSLNAVSFVEILCTRRFRSLIPVFANYLVAVLDPYFESLKQPGLQGALQYPSLLAQNLAYLRYSVPYNDRLIGYSFEAQSARALRR